MKRALGGHVGAGCLMMLVASGACSGDIMGGAQDWPEPASSGPGTTAGAGGAPAGAAGGAGGVSGPGGATSQTDLVGRVPRRMSADQLRAAFLELTGVVYEGSANVRDPDSARGTTLKTNADLLDVYASALGRPDYNYVVNETLEPGVSFSKLVQDAARHTCGQAAEREVGRGEAPGGKPRLLIAATANETLPQAEAAIRANIAVLALRFWGATLEPSSPTVSNLVKVFRAAATTPAWTGPDDKARPAGSPVDGWRAVCIALATDPEFYVY